MLICGDLHLENFGAYRTDAGDFRFDINDFDEALVAPASFDLVRAHGQHLAGRRVCGRFRRSQASRHRARFPGRVSTGDRRVGSQRPNRRRSRSGKATVPFASCSANGHRRTDRRCSIQHTDGHHRRRAHILQRGQAPDVSEKKPARSSKAIEGLWPLDRHARKRFKVLDVTGRDHGRRQLGVRRVHGPGGRRRHERHEPVARRQGGGPVLGAGLREFPQPDIVATKPCGSCRSPAAAAIEAAGRPGDAGHRRPAFSTP